MSYHSGGYKKMKFELYPIMLGKIAVLGLFAMSTGLGLSQETKKSGRTCRLVFPEKPGDSPRFVYLYDGKDSHRVYLSAVNFSDVVKIKSGDISLIMASEAISDPENIPPEYPRILIPEQVKNFYVFLSADKKNPVMPISMNLVNLDTGKFQLGNTLWYNFTNHRIAAKLGESKMTVGARKSTISTGPLAENGYYRAEFIFQPDSTGDFRNITEQQWWFDADSRYVGFIVDRGVRLPGIYFFRDFRNPEPTQEIQAEN